MKFILPLLLLFTAAAQADVCDDLYAKNKVRWDEKNFLPICRDALKGDADAQFDLAAWYGTKEKNYEEAFELLRQSAAQGCAKSQFAAGMMYYQGIGVEIHWIYGRELIERAAESGIPDAISTLGFMYFYGHAVGQNKEHGIELMEKAAAMNSAGALQQLADIYREGEDGPADSQIAISYLVRVFPAIILTAVQAEIYPCTIYNDAGR